MTFSRQAFIGAGALFFLVAGGALLFAAGKSEKPAPAEGVPQVHNFLVFSEHIKREMAGHYQGGYAFEARYEGKVVATAAEGWARAPWEKVNPSLPLTIYKPMALASVSKAITAVAMMKLWDESNHTFSLEDPFYLHMKRLVPKVHDDVKKITIRDLLMHQSGLAKPKNEDVQTIPQLASLLALPAAHPPGEKHFYDNNNFFIVGKLVEEISGEDYTAYVNDHVFVPLGIKDMATHFEKDKPTCGYGEKGDKAPGYPYEWDQRKSAGAAGWYGSADSLCRFLEALHDHRILSAEAEAAMYKDNFGWDLRDPRMKVGDFGFDDTKAHGEIHTSVVVFPDGVEATMLINCKTPKDPGAYLKDAWKASLEKAR